MRHSSLRTLATLAGTMLFLAAGCQATGPKWPAVSEAPTGVHIQGRWVWAELFADNVDTEKAFYHEVFGWEFESRGTGTHTYTLVRADGKPIAGIIHHTKKANAERSARWLPFISVPDAARAAEQATASGGKVVIPPKILPGRGESSVLKDPEGAFFGVVHTDAGDPPDVFPSYNTWIWLELWARDASKMADFYRAIGDYTVTRREEPNDRTELHLVAGGYPRAGILELKHKDRPATWLPYVRVQDLQKTVASVTRAGGRVVMEPNPEVRHGTVAVFLDPLGAAVAAVEWPDENEGEGKP
jgi:predicted enzyme related to lactoylglutathione lyase